MDAVYTCSRCHYQTDKKNNLYRHLTKEKECSTTHSQVSRSSLISELNIQHRDKDNNPFSCPNCNASFKHQSGLSRHSKGCSPQVTPTTIEQMQQTILLLQQEVLALKQQPIQNITINNVNNNTINNNITVQKRPFTNENIDHIVNDHQFMHSCLHNNNVVTLLDAIYCDVKHPENHVVRFKNFNRGIMECYKDGLWTPCKQDDLLNQLLDRGYTILKTYLRRNKDDVKAQVIEEDGDDDTFNQIIDWLDYNFYSSKNIKAIKQDIVILFMTNKALLLGKP